MRAKFRVRITRTAERDLEEAWTFIAQDSPEEAERFVARVETQIESLERFPERCPLIPENEILGTLISTLGLRQLSYRVSNRRQSGLRLARHSWRKTSGHFNVLGLENRNPHNAE